MRQVAICLLVSLSASVAASSSTSPFNPLVLKRQSTICSQSCDAASSALELCGTTVSCICGQTLATAVVDCAKCAYAVDPSSLPTLQATVDQYVSICNTAGYNLGNPQVAGGTAATSATGTLVPTPTSTNTVLPPATSITGAPSPTGTSNLFGTLLNTRTSSSSAPSTGNPLATGNPGGGTLIPSSAATLVASTTALVFSVGFAALLSLF